MFFTHVRLCGVKVDEVFPRRKTAHVSRRITPPCLNFTTTKQSLKTHVCIEHLLRRITCKSLEMFAETCVAPCILGNSSILCVLASCQSWVVLFTSQRGERTMIFCPLFTLQQGVMYRLIHLFMSEQGGRNGVFLLPCLRP